MKTKKKLSKWYYAAAIIFAVGGATGCLYSAAAAAIMIGYGMIRSTRTAGNGESALLATAAHFGIASTKYDDGVIDITGIPPVKQEHAAAA